MRICKAVLLASIVAGTPASATVTFKHTEASSLAGGIIGFDENSNDGPREIGTSYPSGDYVTSKADYRDEFQFVQTQSSAGVGVRLNSLTSADMFMRNSAAVDALTGQRLGRAYSSTTGIFQFAVDTVSLLSLSYTAAGTVGTPSNFMQLIVYQMDDKGLPTDYLQFGDVFGQNTLTYDLPVGNYGIFIHGNASAAVEPQTGGRVSTSNVFGMSVNIDSPAASAAVPEPTTWALMVLGFGAIGAGMRGQRRAGVTIRKAA